MMTTRRRGAAAPRMLSATALAVVALAWLAVVPAARADTRFYFAGQYQWAERRGFYIDVEGGELGKLPLILGVADGKEWRFSSKVLPLEAGRDYKVRAVIGGGVSQMYLDDALVAEVQGGYAPAAAPFEVAVVPGWASDLGDYVMMQRDIVAAVKRDGREVARLEKTLGQDAAANLPLCLFQPSGSQAFPLEVKEGDSLEVSFGFHVEGVDLRKLAPFVDRYGQAIAANWPGKVKSDDDLRDDISREAGILATTPPSDKYDRYGGFKAAGWKADATGFYRTARRDGKWWLITPEGNPCFYLGVCSVPAQTWETTPVTGREFLFQELPPREGPYAAAWSKNQWGVNDGTDYCCLYAANLVRKYGEKDWLDKSGRQAARRLACWGFNGGGKWGAPSDMPQAMVLNAWDTPRLVEHPDVFDPAVTDAFREDLRRQIEPGRDDPFIIGWSFGNEYGEQIKRTEVREILRKPAGTPCKRALMDYALDQLYGRDLDKLGQAWKVAPATREELYGLAPEPPDGDVEQMRQLYEDRYYDFLYTTIKVLDPNHLYLANWIVPGWWESEADWAITARHCDVVGYDEYTVEQDSEMTRRLKREADKPCIIGEFSYPPFYGGQHGMGRYGVFGKDDKDSGDMYYHRIQGAAQDPYCVGAMWFIYHDQPITGRGPGRGEKLVLGEHYCFGLVDGTDRPRWDMVARMREANLAAAQWRLQAPAR